jgi:hypothetical protein
LQILLVSFYASSSPVEDPFEVLGLCVAIVEVHGQGYLEESESPYQTPHPTPYPSHLSAKLRRG